MKTVAIVQARMGSTRLPGKVLKQINGLSVLGHVVDRLRRVPSIDELWIATTSKKNDDPIEDEARRLNIQVYRGSEDDVLDRYYRTAKKAGAEAVLRVTSDCPLIEPAVVEDLICLYRESGSDYASNTLERTYPRGLDAEIFSFSALETAWSQASRPYEREHVTPYLYQHPDVFRCATQRGSEDYSHYRWTLDTEEDWELIRTIFEKCRYEGPYITFEDAKVLLFHYPELNKINAHVEQKKLV
ncbi:acylneuraminate cytidylyltransferase [Paenibacillus sp. MY03]|uniref:cytidylyltransferase domain-containing protein n=1 Tax=Paenibacillus sp. MY03 TaxID=302980 RepID=UPI000B3D2127|nr:glycosyltransferase family protein [Paenibacillus sp. MY03]OUS75128.1 acylneuraminate cytidylyltransferase [Paenibacillus sp. MY03]